MKALTLHRPWSDAIAAGVKPIENRTCPTCGRKNILTRRDVALGYQCNACADRDEGGGW